MNSGTVKEAYILLLAMNFCGLLILLFGASTAREKRVKLLQAGLLQVLFVIIATPIWVTFLSALKKSLTAYSGGGVWQLQPSLFIGLFDEIFYRQFSASEIHFDPAANFLTLFGVLWFSISPRRVITEASRGGCVSPAYYRWRWSSGLFRPGSSFDYHSFAISSI